MEIGRLYQLLRKESKHEKLLSVLLAGLLLVFVSTLAFADGMTKLIRKMALHSITLISLKNHGVALVPIPPDRTMNVGSVLLHSVLCHAAGEADVLFNKNDDEWTDAEWEYFQSKQGELAEVLLSLPS